MSYLKRAQRFFSGLIVVTFFVTNTLTPAPSVYAQNVELLNPAKPVQIPAEWGRVTDFVAVPQSSHVLIHIQEAHANYDAQKNIQNILQHLNKSYGIKLILVEGAGNKLKPELFKFFPKDSALQKTINEKLMQAGELTGAEVFLMDASRASEGWGVENAAAYGEDHAAFKKVFEGRKFEDDFLDSLFLEWQKQASLHLSKDLREFLSRFSFFEDGKIPLQDWLETLKAKALKFLNIDLTDKSQQSEWPVLVRYFRLKDISAQISAEGTRRETDVFLREMKVLRAPEDLLEQVESLLNSGENKELPIYKTRFVFEKLIDALPKDYSFKAYPNLRLHMQQLILLSELQGDQLQNEIRALAKRTTEKLVSTDEERRFVDFLSEYQLLRKLFHLELGREEFQSLRERAIDPVKLVKALGLKDADLSKINVLFGTAIRFYEKAIERENWMMRNAIIRMNEQKQSKAILITGGFHTNGFKEKALQSGSSYVQITPAIGEIAADSQKNYLKALLGSHVISRSHLAPEMITQPSFFQAVSPRFWRRELSVRLVRVRDIVRQAVASFGGPTSENRAEFEEGFQRLIASVVGAPVRIPVAARSETRGGEAKEGLALIGGFIDPKTLPSAAKQFSYSYDAAGVLSSVLPAELSALHKEYSFEFRPVTSSENKEALKNIESYQAKLKAIDSDSTEMYFFSRESLHIALGGRYSDQAGILPQGIIDVAVQEVAKTLKEEAFRAVSIQITGMRPTSNGTIVLDFKSNPVLARLRELAEKSMEAAGWQGAKILKADGKASSGGVISIGKILPDEKGLSIRMRPEILKALHQEILSINETLQRNPITLRFEGVSYSEPQKQFLSNIKTHRFIPFTPLRIAGSRSEVRGKILMVDDDRSMQSSMARLFAMDGYEVVTAGDPEEALVKISEAEEKGAPVELVISDWQMRRADDGARLGKSLGRKIPIVYLSGVFEENGQSKNEEVKKLVAELKTLGVDFTSFSKLGDISDVMNAVGDKIDAVRKAKAETREDSLDEQKNPKARRPEFWERNNKAMQVLTDLQRSSLGFEYSAAAQKHKEVLNRPDWTPEQLARTEQFLRDAGWEKVRSKARPRILVAEDDIVTRTLVVAKLKELGPEVEVVAVKNGREGLAAYEEAKANGTPFDLGVFDLQMADDLQEFPMDGAELASKVQDIPVILSTFGISGDGTQNKEVQESFKRHPLGKNVQLHFPKQEQKKLVEMARQIIASRAETRGGNFSDAFESVRNLAWEITNRKTTYEVILLSGGKKRSFGKLTTVRDWNGMQSELYGAMSSLGPKADFTVLLNTVDRAVQVVAEQRRSELRVLMGEEAVFYGLLALGGIIAGVSHVLKILRGSVLAARLAEKMSGEELERLREVYSFPQFLNTAKRSGRGQEYEAIFTKAEALLKSAGRSIAYDKQGRLKLGGDSRRIIGKALHLQNRARMEEFQAREDGGMSRSGEREAEASLMDAWWHDQKARGSGWEDQFEPQDTLAGMIMVPKRDGSQGAQKTAGFTPAALSEESKRSEAREAETNYTLTVLGPRAFKLHIGKTETWLQVKDGKGREGWFRPSAQWHGSATRTGDMILNAIEVGKEDDGTPVFSVPKRTQRSKTRVVEQEATSKEAVASEKAFLFSAIERFVRVEHQEKNRFSVRLSVRMDTEAIKKGRIFVHFGPYDGGMMWQDQAVAPEEIHPGKEEGQYEIHGGIDPSEAFPGKTGEFGATFFALPQGISREDAGSFNKRSWVGAQGVQDGKFLVKSSPTSGESANRSEARGADGAMVARPGKQIFSLTQVELQGVKGMTVYAYLRSLGIEEASLQNSILIVRPKLLDQTYTVTIGDKNEATPSWAVDGLLAHLRIRDISDVVSIEGRSTLAPGSDVTMRSEMRRPGDPIGGEVRAAGNLDASGPATVQMFEEGFGGKQVAGALEKAGEPVVFLRENMAQEDMDKAIRTNQVIYFEPKLDTDKYDYGASEEALITMAREKIGPALKRVREGEGSRTSRVRKIFILRGMVDPGTSKLIYDTIKWNAHPTADDDLDFDLVFQPDFSFFDARSGEQKEPAAVFGLMTEGNQEFQNKTKEVLDRTFKKFYENTPIRYMNIRSAEMAKEALLIYLGAKLAHFDDIAELSRAYGADLSAAAFGAGLDKRIRTLFTNPSLGFGGRLFVFLNWLYAQRLYKAVIEMEGQAHQKPEDRKLEIEKILRTSVKRLEQGEEITSILKELPVQLHLLFALKTILEVNKQNIVDFYNSITREYKRLYGHGALRGKKVALLSVGYRSQNGKLIASPALLLIKSLFKDEGINEFYIADPDPNAPAALQKWQEEEARENPRFKAVRFYFTKDIYEAAEKADISIIPTVSNPALKTIDIEMLGKALKGKTVFDGMNLFGLRADGTSKYKLEEVRREGINLFGVGRLPLGPSLDNKSGYRLSDSEVIRTVEDYERAITARDAKPSQPVAFRQKNVAVIGGGYVGLVTAANLAALGHKVHVVDIKAKQKEIDALSSSVTAVPIYEPGLREMIIEGKSKGLLTFSTELETAVKDASIVYLAVGTPSQDTGEVDLKYILKASEDVGRVIKQHGGRKAIVIKSTVTPDTFKKMDETLKAQGLKLGEDYVPVSNPEFLREGQAIEDVTKPDRTVLGFYAALTPEHRASAEKEILELWYPLMLKHPHTVLLTDTASSTIVKYLANSFLAISITLSNLFAEAAEWDNADFQEVRMPLATDERIGPNAFLASGIGYGGSCFPKDVLALHFSSKDSTGHALPLIGIATGFNDYFKKAVVKRTVEKVAAFPKAARPLAGETVVMLGMAFKADTDDMREASSAYVLHELLVNGVKQVRLHDPILSMPNVPAPEVVKDHFLDYLFKTFQKDEDFQVNYQRHKKIALATEEKAPTEAEYFKKQYFQEKYINEGRVVFQPDLEKLGQADILFLVTEWSQYKDLDLSKFKSADKKLWVVDGRNLFYSRRYEISKFADYMGIGTTITSPRSEMRNYVSDESPLAGYTVVSRQLEAGFDRTILEGLNKHLTRRFAARLKDVRRFVGLVAETTLTGGLGALMHDLFGAWSKNFGPQKQKNLKDIIAINAMYETIKGQKFAKGLPEEISQGRRSLGDYLRGVLKKDESLGFHFTLEIGDDFRRKALEQDNFSARQVIGRTVYVDVYKTDTHFGGMANYYLDAYLYNENGEKTHIFDEVYPDAFFGKANLWRDVHMAVYGWSSQYLVKKLQENGVVKKNILFVNNEVFVSTPTPLFPKAIHHHINHTVFRPGLYTPDEASYDMLGYPEVLRRYIVKNGKINIVDAVGLSSHVITGVGLYEHTPVLAREIVPTFINKLQEYNSEGVRNTNGALFEQWQAPLLSELMERFKEKLKLAPESSHEDLFKALRLPGNAALLDEFQKKAEFIKSAQVAKFLLWLKEEQNYPAWIEEVISDYKESMSSIGVDEQRLIRDYESLVAGALDKDSNWEKLQKTPGIEVLKEALLQHPIVSNIRRQVSYKGPDKWIEILVGLERDPEALRRFKQTAARVVIGGREFGADAHNMFLGIQRLVKQLGLERQIVTIENYNIQDAVTIFQGVAATVMLSDEYLEASATSMMKAVTNMGALIGVWGGAMPELFTIVETKNGREMNVFTDNVTHNELVANLRSGEWKITNGFLVEYSDDEMSSQQGGGRRPLASSLVRALVDLKTISLDPVARRNLQFDVLASSPKVDMEMGQARAHIKLWEKAIKSAEDEEALFSGLKISPEESKALLSKSLAVRGQPEFTWFKDDASQPLSAGRRMRGLLGFVEGFREIRMKEKDGYLSLVHHSKPSEQAPEGDIFAYLNEFLAGFGASLEPVITKIKELDARARATQDAYGRVRLNLEALEIVERLAVQVSVELFRSYVRTQDRSIEELLAQSAVRENLARYFGANAVAFESIAQKIQGYAVTVDGQKYILALNLGEFSFESDAGSKAWGGLYSREAFQEVLGREAMEDDSRIYQVQDVITGKEYGSYALWQMAETLPIGISSPGVQALRLADTGKKTEQKETRVSNDVLNYLDALAKGRLVSEGKPITGLLFQRIKKNLDSPEQLKTILKVVVELSKEEAVTRFGTDGIPPVMAFVATLSPVLLEEMKDWNSEVYEKLRGIIHNPSSEKLFKEGKVWFNRVDRDSAIVLSRSLPNKPMPHIVVPIHFAGAPYRPEDGKAWFRLLDVQNLGVQNSADVEYQAYDHLFRDFYPVVHYGDQLYREKWHIGVPIIAQKDKAGFDQPSYRFQVIEIRPVRIPKPFSETEEDGVGRSEMRNYVSDESPLAGYTVVSRQLKEIASGALDAGVRKTAEQFLAGSLVAGGRKGSSELDRVVRFISENALSRSEVRGIENLRLTGGDRIRIHSWDEFLAVAPFIFDRVNYEKGQEVKWGYLLFDIAGTYEVLSPLPQEFKKGAVDFQDVVREESADARRNFPDQKVEIYVDLRNESTRGATLIITTRGLSNNAVESGEILRALGQGARDKGPETKDQRLKTEDQGPRATGHDPRTEKPLSQQPEAASRRGMFAHWVKHAEFRASSQPEAGTAPASEQPAVGRADQSQTIAKSPTVPPFAKGDKGDLEAKSSEAVTRPIRSLATESPDAMIRRANMTASTLLDAWRQRHIPAKARILQNWGASARTLLQQMAAEEWNVRGKVADLEKFLEAKTGLEKALRTTGQLAPSRSEARDEAIQGRILKPQEYADRTGQITTKGGESLQVALRRFDPWLNIFNDNLGEIEEEVVVALREFSAMDLYELGKVFCSGMEKNPASFNMDRTGAARLGNVFRTQGPQVFLSNLADFFSNDPSMTLRHTLITALIMPSKYRSVGKEAEAKESIRKLAMIVEFVIRASEKPDRSGERAPSEQDVFGEAKKPLREIIAGVEAFNPRLAAMMREYADPAAWYFLKAEHRQYAELLSGMTWVEFLDEGKKYSEWKDFSGKLRYMVESLENIGHVLCSPLVTAGNSIALLIEELPEERAEFEKASEATDGYSLRSIAPLFEKLARQFSQDNNMARQWLANVSVLTHEMQYTREVLRRWALATDGRSALTSNPMIWGENVTADTIRQMAKEGYFGTDKEYDGDKAATERIREGNRFIVKLVQDTVAKRVPQMSKAAAELVRLKPMGVLSTSAFFDPAALGMPEKEWMDKQRQATEELEYEDLPVLEALMTVGWDVQIEVALGVLSLYDKTTPAAEIVFNQTSWLTSFGEGLANFLSGYELSGEQQALVTRAIGYGRAAKGRMYGLVGAKPGRTPAQIAAAQTKSRSEARAEDYFPDVHSVKITSWDEFIRFAPVLFRIGLEKGPLGIVWIEAIDFKDQIRGIGLTQNAEDFERAVRKWVAGNPETKHVSFPLAVSLAHYPHDPYLTLLLSRGIPPGAINAADLISAASRSEARAVEETEKILVSHGVDVAALAKKWNASEQGDWVLVVDDHEALRSGVAKIIQDAKYQTVTASDVIAALEVIRDRIGKNMGRPLIVTDDSMPLVRGVKSNPAMCVRGSEWIRLMEDKFDAPRMILLSTFMGTDPKAIQKDLRAQDFPAIRLLDKNNAFEELSPLLAQIKNADLAPSRSALVLSESVRPRKNPDASVRSEAREGASEGKLDLNAVVEEVLKRLRPTIAETAAQVIAEMMKNGKPAQKSEVPAPGQRPIVSLAPRAENLAPTAKETDPEKARFKKNLDHLSRTVRQPTPRQLLVREIRKKIDEDPGLKEKWFSGVRNIRERLAFAAEPKIRFDGFDEFDIKFALYGIHLADRYNLSEIAIGEKERSVNDDVKVTALALNPSIRAQVLQFCESLDVFFTKYPRAAQALLTMEKGYTKLVLANRVQSKQKFSRWPVPSYLRQSHEEVADREIYMPLTGEIPGPVPYERLVTHTMVKTQGRDFTNMDRFLGRLLVQRFFEETTKRFSLPVSAERLRIFVRANPNIFSGKEVPDYFTGDEKRLVREIGGKLMAFKKAAIEGRLKGKAPTSLEDVWPDFLTPVSLVGLDEFLVETLSFFLLDPAWLRASDPVTFEFWNALTGGKFEDASVRSELRAPGVINTAEEFFRINQEKGGGTEYGVRAVMEKIMDGIFPLLANTLNVAEKLFAFFYPVAYAQDVLDITAKPETFLDRARLSAVRMALHVKTLKASDAFILGPEFALDHGAIGVMRKIFGDVPFVILTRNDRDLRFIEKINTELAQANRPSILAASDLNNAKMKLRKGRTVPLNLKAMVFASEPSAVMLKEQLKDDAILVTSKMFQNFLNLAGVSKLVEQMQAEFAILRSA